MSHAPLPPGTPGLPLLGETLAYMKNGFDFVETRIARHGMVFRTSLLGQPVAVLCGPDATEAFMDPARVKRENAMPANVAMLFAGKVLPVLDGAEHRERKGYVLAAFTPEAMNEGFPLVRTLARQALGDIVDREVGLVDVVKTLSLKSICEYMYGAIPDAALAQLEHDYDVITRAGAALPISLPGTTFTKGKQALARILASYRERIAEHRATPRPDGLTRLLAQRGSDGQRTIGDDEASRELHHIVIAGLIIWCWGATAIRQLASDQGLRDALRAEANALPADYDAAAVSHLPLLDRFTMETQRITPILPQVFGRAATTFEFKGYQIPEGWMLLWAWHETHMRPEVYSDPARFDPARFDAPRREDQKCPHAFAPQGAGDVRQTHKCVGYELAPLMFKAFIVELVRGYEMTLSPGQDLNLDRTKMPPGPRDGLKATLTRRA